MEKYQGNNDVMIKDAAVSTPDESWKSITLTQIVNCKYLVNGHSLQLSDEIGKNLKIVPDNTVDTEEASWQCDGVTLFKDGCKSGQQEFDLYTDTYAWSCDMKDEANDGDDSDFDICEMCIRWAIHCEKTGISPNFANGK